MLRRSKDRPTLTVHFGDMHIGGTEALCPPKVRLDDGGWHIPSPLCSWYWECWLRFWQDTAALKKEHRAWCVGICGGDERDGDHHGTTQIWAKTTNDQDRAVIEALNVAEPVVDEWIFVRGTEAHDGPAAAATERYAEHFAGKGWNVVRNGDLFSWWVYTGVHGGVKFEVAHAPGTKSWAPHTQAPATARHAFYTRKEYLDDGIEPPDVVIRHHVHYHSGPGCEQDTCCFIVPAWQARANWIANRGVVSARKVRRPGGLRLLCEGGEWRKFWKLYRPPSGVAWAKT